MGTEAQYIFLSHNSEDKADVLKLVEQLERHPLAKQNGIHVWLDERDLQHGKEHVAQFAERITDQQTLAFLLLMPQKSVDGYVSHEIQTAFDRHQQEQKLGKLFPILPIYPDEQHKRMALPHPIKAFPYRDQVRNDEQKIDLILRDVIQHTDKHTPSNMTQTPSWRCITLYRQANHIIAEDEDEQRHPIDPHLLSPNHANKNSQAIQQWLSINPHDRLRLMTDDPALAMLPWHSLLESPTVECSPTAKRYYEGFEPTALHIPLTIIPSDKQHRIASNKHYTTIAAYFNSHLDIPGHIPKANTQEQTEQELALHQPDFIYLYARYDGQNLHLDNQQTLTLNQLAELLENLPQQRPIVILSLIGSKLSDYPEKLIKQCRLLWIQSGKFKRNSKDIETQLTRVLEGLRQNGDLIKLINKHSTDPSLQSQCWVNGKSPQIDLNGDAVNTTHLRAALLRVMLGREALKNQLYGTIVRQENTRQRHFFIYNITGEAAACPLDFPTQLQHRIDWEDLKNGLPMLSYDFPITIKHDSHLIDLIEDSIDQGLLHRTDNIETAFQELRHHRGLLKHDCCISLNWCLRFDPSINEDEQYDLLNHWMVEWTEHLCQEIAFNIPPNAVMLAAICIETPHSNAQTIQDKINRQLSQLRRNDCPIKPIRNREALGTLQADEISDFLQDNEQWRQHLNIETYDIDVYDYADWVHEQTKGDFDLTVKQLWKQYRNDYADYFKTKP